MTIVQDAIAATREALLPSNDVKRVGDGLKELAIEVRDHDKRIIKLEAKLEKAARFCGYPKRAPRQPRRGLTAA